jgi:tetratricopeptide (TPR) repeat protein
VRTLFLLLLFIAGVAASAWLRRRGHARRMRLWVAINDATSRRDWSTAERLMRQGLTEKRPPEEIVWLHIHLGTILLEQDRFADALAALDEIEGQLLGPYWMASWLTSRAYALAELDRANAALADLDQAETLLIGQDDARTRYLRACVWGNRAVAHLVAGRLDQAESWTTRAYDVAVELDQEPARPGEIGDLPTWIAEHWWWRSEIARRSGRHDEARRHLTRAAAYPSTKWGARAIAALATRNGAAN